MTIIIYGNNNDTSLSNILFKALTKYGYVQLYNKKRLICSTNFTLNSSSKFILYELDKLPSKINCEGLFIFKNSFKNLRASNFPKKFLPIVDSQNLQALKCLEKTSQIVITCGTSSKNTLSFSSFSNSEAIISLQRYLKTKNKIIEPHEFSLKITDSCSPITLLIICAVLLLSDISSINGYEI